MRSIPKTATHKLDASSSLRQRAGRLRDAAARFLKRGSAVIGTDQPQPTSLPEGTAVERSSTSFTSAGTSRNPADRLDAATVRTPAEGDGQPSQENDMGRREVFQDAQPVNGDLFVEHRLATQPQNAAHLDVADRAALVNYATFLHCERRAVCAELYPHMGVKADRFVLSMNEAWAFFSEGRDDVRPRKDLPLASTRAVKVLDLVGIDWRKDRDAGGVAPDNDRGMHDTGERPKVPRGWPAPDAELTAYAADLPRLAAAIAALRQDDDRDDDDVPGLVALLDAQDEALSTLSSEPAESASGLHAKATAILTGGVEYDTVWLSLLGKSLARDLLGARPSDLEPRPDPIFAVIEESRRLYDVWTAASRLPEIPGTIERPPEDDAASDAFHEHREDKLLKTVPTTAEGCKALARWALDYRAVLGLPIDDTEHGGEHLRILDLIARSPLL